MKKTLLAVLVIAAFSAPAFSGKYGYVCELSGKCIKVPVHVMDAIEKEAADKKAAHKKAAKEAAARRRAFAKTNFFCTRY